MQLKLIAVRKLKLYMEKEDCAIIYYRTVQQYQHYILSPATVTQHQRTSIQYLKKLLVVNRKMQRNPKSY